MDILPPARKISRDSSWPPPSPPSFWPGPRAVPPTRKGGPPVVPVRRCEARCRGLRRGGGGRGRGFTGAGPPGRRTSRAGRCRVGRIIIITPSTPSPAQSPALSQYGPSGPSPRGSPSRGATTIQRGGLRAGPLEIPKRRKPSSTVVFGATRQSLPSRNHQQSTCHGRSSNR